MSTLVFESPGKLPGLVKPANIRTTHFSRNPKIAAFLKAYHYVKEFGEGLDRICREQEANGAKAPSFRTDEFILKVREDPYISTSKMAEIIGIDRRNIARNIKKLQDQGVIHRVGPDKGGFWEIIE